MDHDTTYLGQLRVEPPLGAAELSWLTSFAEWGGGPDGDPFVLPMNPRAVWQEVRAGEGDGGGPAAERTGGRRGGVPPDVVDWVPCDEGCHLVWRPAPGSNDPILALRFLVDHFLGPRALARGRGADFEDFTFDHRVDGVLAGFRDDTEELFVLRAEDSRFRRETLDPGRGSAVGAPGQDAPDAWDEPGADVDDAPGAPDPVVRPLLAPRGRRRRAGSVSR